MVDERLPSHVERRVVELRRGEGGGVDGGEAHSMSINPMLLNKLHAPPPLPSLTLLGR
jgi:hypothetical protein